MAHTRNGAAAQVVRQEKALIRMADRSMRSDAQQIARLDAGGYAAKRERERLRKR
jgi:hypothetical protein